MKREEIMYNICLFKWLWCESFRNDLNTDQSFLVCGKDKFWTCGYAREVALVMKPNECVGQNILGTVLANVRDFFKGVDVLTFRNVYQTLSYAEDKDDDDVMLRNKRTFDTLTNVTDIFDFIKSTL